MATYNDIAIAYNGWMGRNDHVMTVSGNGQVSIPAAARARWRTRRVLVLDLGDRVVVRPLPKDATADELQGKYGGRGPDTATARAAQRNEDAAAERPARSR
jgi:hypothetical protein